MIKEIVHFMEHLDDQFKTLRLKPKEGVHIIFEAEKQKDGSYWVNPEQYQYERSTKKMNEYSVLLDTCSLRTHHGWMLNSNKSLDKKKGIHSASPFMIGFKLDFFDGGSSPNKAKNIPLIPARLENYFNQTQTWIQDSELSLKAKAFATLFQGNSSFYKKIKDNIQQKLTNSYQDLIEQIQVLELKTKKVSKEEKLDLKVKVSALKLKAERVKPLESNEYIIFYLDVPMNLHEGIYQSYLSKNLFNDAKYNLLSEQLDREVGTSSFLTSYDGKKKFQLHKSATFDILQRISLKDSYQLFLFEKMLSRKALPNPLPLFVFEEELNTSMIGLFKTSNYKLSYQEIILQLLEKHQKDLNNYYLLYYQSTTKGPKINDFDFVAQFQYHLYRGAKQATYTIQNLFDTTSVEQSERRNPEIILQQVFELERQVFYPLLQNKKNQLDYFGDLEKKNYQQLDETFFCYSKYRLAVYNYIYKSQHQSITGKIFDEMVFRTILDDLKHHRPNKIKHKLNIWFSLYEYFHHSSNSTTSMAQQLSDYQNFVTQLAEATTQQTPAIPSTAHFAFAVGQVIYYVLKKSKSADNSYRLLEPYLQQVHCSQLQQAIAKDITRYKHEPFSKRFERVAAVVLTHSTPDNLKDYLPQLLAGYFANNSLFPSKKQKEREDLME